MFTCVSLFRLNYVGEFNFWKKALGEPQCLFKVPDWSLGAFRGGVCDDIENKCKTRCAARKGAPARVLCRCSGGSAVMQCADELEPLVLHPEGGVGGVVGQGATSSSNGTALVTAPAINVAEAMAECERATTCSECAAKRMCGWCASAARCLAGDVDQRPTACFEGDWLYDSCHRDPKLAFTTIGANERWSAGEMRSVKWTWRQDVPVPSVALSFRWSATAPWLHLVEQGVVDNVGTLTFRVPDGVPASDSFQLMVQALPKAATPTTTTTTTSMPALSRELLEQYGRAYALSPLIKLVAPLACAGPNGEAGSCVSQTSCREIGGVDIYSGRRDERAGCTAIADTSVRCCTSVKLRRRNALANGAARVVVGAFGACPACSSETTLVAKRDAYCFDGSATPRLLRDKADAAACVGGATTSVPTLETACGVLPQCKFETLSFVKVSV